MKDLDFIENFIDTNHNHYSSFLIEPLENGQGITLGNSLRRTLLTEITSFSTTAIKINNVVHEFVTISGIKEDIVEIILNIKEIVFKDKFFVDNKINETIFGFFYGHGPLIVTAGMLKLPQNRLQIVNPSLPICTIIDTTEFFIEIRIECGNDILLNNDNEQIKSDILVDSFATPLFINTNFSPVKRVNYHVRLIYDSYGTIKESLFFEILTNGSTTPKRAIQDSLKLLLKLFYPLVTHKLLCKLSKILKLKTLFRLKKNSRMFFV